MKLKDVVSIGGKPGLHKIVGQRHNGLIVETIDDRKKRFPTSLTQKVSILEDISIYTLDEDVLLKDVFKSLDAKVKEGLQLPVKKDGGDAIRDFFRQVLPNFDEDQVYTSDILKICNWYGILKDLVDFQNLDADEDEGEDKASISDKPAPKAKKKPANAGAKSSKATAKSAPAKAPKVTQRKMS